MANLINRQTGEKVSLLAQHHIGRHPESADTVITSPAASRLHATIRWNGQCWSLQDNSTNGTYINGTQLPLGSECILSLADKIHFASPTSDGWQVSSLTPPHSVLVPVTPNAKPLELGNITALPSEESPQITLYQSASGHWLCESDSGINALTSGDRVGTKHAVWRFVEAKNQDNNQDNTHSTSRSVATASDVLVFFKTQTEKPDNTALALQIHGQSIQLGEQQHHQVILMLAHQQIADKKAVSEQGWVNNNLLCQQLNINENQLNALINQFRKQLINTLPKNLILPQAIEKRSGQHRFIYANIQINNNQDQRQPFKLTAANDQSLTCTPAINHQKKL
ncbi:MAG: hypothetical protein ACI8WB_001863 [Phenylobacterium sp.]|jgi:hypothetical protein